MDEHIAEKAELYWRRDLDDATLQIVERHLAGCDSCRAEFDAIRVAMHALADWEREVPVDRAFEDRLVALRPRNAHTARAIRVAAVLLLCLASAVGGYRVGHSRPPEQSVASEASDTSLKTFILLLEEPAWPPPAPLERPGYREWVRDLSVIHRYIAAEKLTEEPGVRVAVDGQAAAPNSATPSRNLSGWYLIRARDYADAVQLVRQGPHLRYGSILVRQLE